MVTAVSAHSHCQRRLWHQRFLGMLPKIQQHIAWHLRKAKPAEREDLYCEAVGLAFAMFLRLAEQGRVEQAYPSPLAAYACRQALAGRRLGGSLNVSDVMSKHCQQKKGITVERLDGVEPLSERWHEIVLADSRATPADIAATRIDFSEWLDSLPKRSRRVAEMLATGENTNAVASMLGLSAGRVSQLRHVLYYSWREFQGETVPDSP